MSDYREAVARLLAESEELVKAGRHAEGEERAQRVLTEQPRNPAGHYLLAVSALMQGRSAAALPHIESALRVDRANAQYHFMAGVCLSRLARLEDAVLAYRRALQYRHDFLEARANLGYLHECAGRIDEAVACYREVLAGDPQQWYSLNRLGYCERLLERPEEALALFGRALALQPQFAPTENEVALALMQLGRKAEAIEAFRRAVALDPSFLAAWCNLGKLLYLDHVVASGIGPSDAAPLLECFDKILALDPGNLEFTHLRDSVSGARVERPPDAYVAEFFDRFAPYFESRVGELDYSAPRVAAEALTAWLASRNGLRVLDLGCGTGLSGEIVRGAKGRLVGVDLSPAMLARARERGLYDELVEEEIGSYLERIEPGSCDLVLALDVFVYVGQPERVLAGCARALAPAGRMVFSVEELGDADGDFALVPSGRYAHARAWMAAAVERAGMCVEGTRDFAIRVESQRPLPAILFDCAKP